MFGTLEHNLSDVRGCVSSEADLHFLTTCCSTCFLAAWILPRFDSLSMSCICLPFLSLPGSPSWSSEEGIHVPVPRTSVGPYRTPVLLPAPALSAWMSSYSAVWTALVSLFVAHVPKVCHAPSLFITTRLYKWDEGGNGGYSGWEEPAERGGVRETKASLIQSSFVLLGCRGQLVISMQHLTIQIPVLTASQSRSWNP